MCWSIVLNLVSIIAITGVNGMTTAKTALHTANECDMYAHVSPFDMTGEWEWISEFVAARVVITVY
jgi:hypothetical protein